MNHYASIISAYDKLTGSGINLKDDYIASARIHGKPAIDWLVDSMRKVPTIKKIVSIGPPELDQLVSSRYIDIAIATNNFDLHKKMPGSNESLLTNLNLSGSYHILFVHCGLLYLQPSDLKQLINAFEKNSAEIAFPFTIAEQNIEKGYTVKVPIKNGGALIIHTKVGFAADSGFIDKYFRFQSFLKTVEAQNGRIVADSVRDAEIRISDLYGVKISLLPFRNEKTLQPVTTVDAVILAEKRLPNPWHNRFPNTKIIINPRSGAKTPAGLLLNKWSGYKQSIARESLSSNTLSDHILSCLQQYGIQAEVIQLESNTTLHDLVKRNHDPDLIIAAGGDGTINSVINVLAFSGIPLGIIPLGTANVFSIELNIPSDIRSACQLIAQSEIRSVDIGKINGRFFSCVAGIGIDAYISRHVETQSQFKHFFGGAAYIIIGISDFFKYRFRTIHLTVDDQPIVRNGYLVIVANGKHYGGKLVFAPKARLDDGLLDIVIFKSRNIVSVLRYLYGFLHGTLPDFATVEYLQAKKIEVSGTGHHQVHIDGDYAGHTPVNIEIAPSALNVLY